MPPLLILLSLAALGFVVERKRRLRNERPSGLIAAPPVLVPLRPANATALARDGIKLLVSTTRAILGLASHGTASTLAPIESLTPVELDTISPSLGALGVPEPLDPGGLNEIPLTNVSESLIDASGTLGLSAIAAAPGIVTTLTSDAPPEQQTLSLATQAGSVAAGPYAPIVQGVGALISHLVSRFLGAERSHAQREALEASTQAYPSVAMLSDTILHRWTPEGVRDGLAWAQNLGQGRWVDVAPIIVTLRGDIVTESTAVDDLVRDIDALAIAVQAGIAQSTRDAWDQALLGQARFMLAMTLGVRSGDPLALRTFAARWRNDGAQMPLLAPVPLLRISGLPNMDVAQPDHALVVLREWRIPAVLASAYPDTWPELEDEIRRPYLDEMKRWGGLGMTLDNATLAHIHDDFLALRARVEAIELRLTNLDRRLAPIPLTPESASAVNTQPFFDIGG